jgi:hypothetical protein
LAANEPERLKVARVPSRALVYTSTAISESMTNFKSTRLGII